MLAGCLYATKICACDKVTSCLGVVDLLRSYNEVCLHSQIPIGSHPVSIMHKTNETSECCRVSPPVFHWQVSSEDFEFTDEELTDAGLSGTGECLVHLHICHSLIVPIVDASRSVTQTIDIMKKHLRFLGCELFSLASFCVYNTCTTCLDLSLFMLQC